MECSFTLLPFTVPDNVALKGEPRRRQDGFERQTVMPLADVSEGSLSDLCKQFRRDVFRKAGKIDPEEIGATKEPK